MIIENLTTKQLREKHADVLENEEILKAVNLRWKHEGNPFDTKPYQINIFKEIDDAKLRIYPNSLLTF